MGRGSGSIPIHVDVEVPQLPPFTPQPAFVNVKEYGALGNGINDDTLAITLAISALPNKGGILYFPPGTYPISSMLNFNEFQGLVIRGAGGVSANGGASIIKYTGKTATSIISARSTTGVTLIDITIGYTSIEWTGTMVDLSATGEVGKSAGRGLDTQLATLQRIFLTSLGGSFTNCERGVLLDHALNVKIQDSNITSCTTGVVGRINNETYSNTISITGTRFGSNVTHSSGAGQAWKYSSCTFEGSAALEPSALKQLGILASNTSFIGCWFGDVGAGRKTTQIEWTGSGLAVEGCYIAGQKAAGNIGVSISTNGVHSVVIRGNKFENLGIGIAWNKTGASYYDLTGNDFTECEVLFESPTESFMGVVPNSGLNTWRYLGGNVSVSTPGKGLRVAEGANAKQGLVTLEAGKKVVANTSISATSRIFLCVQKLGTVAVPSGYCVSAREAGVGFTILASIATDTSEIAYEIFEIGE